MDKRLDNWGGQEMSLAEAAKMLQSMALDGGAGMQSPEDRQKAEAAQKRSVKMANILSTGINKLHDKLVASKTAGEMKENLRDFYDRLPKFMQHFGLMLENSDAMKFLFGIYNEYMNYLPDGEDEVVQGQKFDELAAILVGYIAALQNVNYYRDWNALEKSIGELSPMTGVTEFEMADLNYELEFLDQDDGEMVNQVLDTAASLEKKPVADELYRFAMNETDLGQMARLVEIWRQVRSRLSDLDLPVPADVDESN
jgi:hypothetical protein